MDAQKIREFGPSWFIRCVYSLVAQENLFRIRDQEKVARACTNTCMVRRAPNEAYSWQIKHSRYNNTHDANH